MLSFRSVFGGTIGPNPLKGESTGSLYYEGIRVRASPAQVVHPGQTAAAVNTSQVLNSGGTGNNVVTVVSGVAGNGTTAAKVQQQAQQQQRNDSAPTQASPSSPILKAQLSAPAKAAHANPTNSPLKAPSPVTSNVPIEPKSQVGPLRVSLINDH
jgi:hypothetical protein